MAWGTLRGHDAQVERFRRALARERLASTFLFVGPPGIGKRSFAFSIRQIENYNITDLAMLPNGDILLLQRSYGPMTLPGMAMSRFPASDIKLGKTIQPETLLEAKVPFYAIDNMEGLAVCERNGELRINILSDNNFKTELQRTLLLQFAYAP